MIREDRLEHMTRMAMYEKKEGQSLKIAQEYRKVDYVGTRSFITFVVGTLVYIAAYSGIVFGLLYNYDGNLHFRLVAGILFAGLIIYVIFMFLLIMRIRKRALARYKKGKAAEKVWKKMLDELEELYRQEEQKDKA